MNLDPGLYAILRSAAFTQDTGPNESSHLWKLLDDYQRAKKANELTVECLQNKFSVATVLEEPEVLILLQHNHQPLVEFLTEKRNLAEILRSITRTDCDSFSKKSCKILCHSSSVVRDAIFTDAVESLDILFGFTENAEQSKTLLEIEEKSANLLCQVVNKFLSSHPWYIVDYFSSKTAFNHSPDQLIYSRLITVLSDINYSYVGSSLAKWLESINIIDKLIETFNGSNGEMVIEIASEVLMSIVSIPNSPLFKLVESEESISNLIDFAFSDQNKFKSFAESQGLLVLNGITAKYKEGYIQPPKSINPIIKNIHKFNQILSNNKLEEVIVNTAGQLKPFGMKRMRIVELYKNLIYLKNDEINNVLLDNHIFDYLFESFFQNKWNNILQTSVMSMFQSVITVNNPFSCKKIITPSLVDSISNKLLLDLKADYAGESVSVYYGFLKDFKEQFRILSKNADYAPVFNCSNAWKDILQFDNDKVPLPINGNQSECKKEINSTNCIVKDVVEHPPHVFDQAKTNTTQASNDNNQSEYNVNEQVNEPMECDNPKELEIQ